MDKLIQKVVPISSSTVAPVFPLFHSLPVTSKPVNMQAAADMVRPSELYGDHCCHPRISKCNTRCRQYARTPCSTASWTVRPEALSRRDHSIEEFVLGSYQVGTLGSFFGRMEGRVKGNARLTTKGKNHPPEMTGKVI